MKVMIAADCQVWERKTTGNIFVKDVSLIAHATYEKHPHVV